MGSTGVGGYGGCMKDRRVSDRLGGLVLFGFNPLMWGIDAVLQKIWPLGDPQPPRGIGLGRRVVWEGRQFAWDVAFVVVGLVAAVAVGLVVLLLAVGLIGVLTSL